MTSVIGRNTAHLKKLVFTSLLLSLLPLHLHPLNTKSWSPNDNFVTYNLISQLLLVLELHQQETKHPTMKKFSFPDSVTFAEKPSQFAECWFDDACILDMDYFVKTIAGIKEKGVRPDLIGSIIAHYASKWLPDLSNDDSKMGLTNFEESTESVTASWMKKRFFVETLVGILPPEKDSLPCNFLLRLLRIANMVNVELTFREELEKRISWQLDQASLKEILIPSFSHTCGTLLDVELVSRLVKRFINLDSEGAKSGAALVKVAKLVDCFLVEAAMDSNLSLSEFVELASVLPSHARATDDGLYRAIDTYLKVSFSTLKFFFYLFVELCDSVVLVLDMFSRFYFQLNSEKILNINFL